jgi:Uma2 family endonuclease
VLRFAMVSPSRQRFTFREYIALEEVAAVKHEFLDGHAWAMAGGSPEHAAIAANVIALLAVSLRGTPCRVFSADLRVRVKASGLSTYPDVTVVRGPLERDPDDPSGNTVINPTVVVEVLSPSTEDYDRGEKVAHYKQIASLQEIVLVAQDEQRLEIWRRQGDRWTLGIAAGSGRLHLASLAIDASVAEVYGAQAP